MKAQVIRRKLPQQHWTENSDTRPVQLEQCSNFQHLSGGGAKHTTLCAPHNFEVGALVRDRASSYAAVEGCYSLQNRKRTITRVTFALVLEMQLGDSWQLARPFTTLGHSSVV